LCLNLTQYVQFSDILCLQNTIMIKNFIDKLRKINNNTFDAKFWIQKNLLEKKYKTIIFR